MYNVEHGSTRSKHLRNKVNYARKPENETTNAESQLTAILLFLKRRFSQGFI